MKKLKRNLISAAMVLTLALVLNSTASAQRGEGRGMGDRDRSGPPHSEGKDWGRGNGPDGKFQDKMHEKLMEQLNLTAEQKEKIEAHRKAHREKSKALREKTREAREELKTELDKTKVDEKSVEAVASELKKLEAEIIDERISGILELKKILTPEQDAKLIKLRNQQRDENRNRDKKDRKGMGRGNEDERGEGPKGNRENQ